MKKLMLLAAAGVGYVLGTRAGRARYEQIRRAVRKVAGDPRVQSTAHHAAELAKEKAPVVKDKLAEAGSTAAAKVTWHHAPIRTGSDLPTNGVPQGKA